VVGVMPWFVRLGARGDHDPEEGLAAVIERCQPRAQTASAAEPDHTGVGVALTMAYVVWPRAWVVHIGDSRGYLLRRGHLGRITRDRATAQQLQGEDVLDLGKAGTSTWKNVLRNANGGAGPTDPDVYRLDLEAGDTLLLCTNGLTEVLTDEELARALARDASPEGLACRLVDKARARGAHDDATALVTRLE
jgi:serine/threonine protein phosphatase PrpC